MCNFISNLNKHNICMKRIILFLLSIFYFLLPCLSETFQGGVSELGTSGNNRIVDKATGQGIGNAKINLPKQHYSTKTNKDGYFELDTVIDSTSILSIQKEHYKPFSMTVNELTSSTPLIIGIEKSNAHSMSLDSSMYHLGDNSFSENSANAGEFSMSAVGPFYTKRFTLKNINISKPVYLVIGSIIGIDTEMARSLGQNHIKTAYATPPEVYFNGNKIAEIQINGDGQKIKLPHSLLKKNQVNELTIKTGRNLMQTAYIDFDDIEFMNLIIEN